MYYFIISSTCFVLAIMGLIYSIISDELSHSWISKSLAVIMLLIAMKVSNKLGLLEKSDND